MLGKEKLKQMFQEKDDVLVSVIGGCNVCPSELGLKSNCQRSCFDCWKESLETEI